MRTRVSLIAAVMALTMAACRPGAITYEEFRSEAENYRTEIAGSYRGFYQAIEDGDETVALSRARGAVEAIERFERDVLSRAPDPCFAEVVEAAREDVAFEHTEIFGE